MAQLLAQSQTSSVPSTVSDQREMITVFTPDGQSIVIPTTGLTSKEISQAVSLAVDPWGKKNALERIASGELTNANGNVKTPLYREKEGVTSIQWDNYDVNFDRDELLRIGGGDSEAGKKIARDAVEAWGTNCMIPGFPGKRTLVIQDWHDDGNTTPHLRLSVSRIPYKNVNECFKMVPTSSGEIHANEAAFTSIMKAIGITNPRINASTEYRSKPQQQPRQQQQQQSPQQQPQQRPPQQIDNEIDSEIESNRSDQDDVLNHLPRDITSYGDKIPLLGMTGGVYGGGRQALEDQAIYDDLAEAKKARDTAVERVDYLEQIVSIKHGYNNLENEFEKIKQVLADTTIERDRFQADAVALGESLGSVQESYNNDKISWSEERGEIQSQLKEAVEDSIRLEEENALLTEKNQQLNTQIEPLESQIKSLKGDNRAWSDRYAEQSAELHRVSTEHVAVSTELQTVLVNFANAELTLAEIGDKYKQAVENTASLTEQNEGLTKELEKLRLDNAVKSSKLEDVTKEHKETVELLQSRIEELIRKQGAANTLLEQSNLALENFKKSNTQHLERMENFHEAVVQGLKKMGASAEDIADAEQAYERDDVSFFSNMLNKEIDKYQKKAANYDAINHELFLKDKELQELNERFANLSTSLTPETDRAEGVSEDLGRLEKKIEAQSEILREMGTRMAFHEKEANQLRAIAGDLIKQQSLLANEVNVGREMAGVERIEIGADGSLTDATGSLPVMKIPSLPEEYKASGNAASQLVERALNDVHAEAEKMAREQAKKQGIDDPDQGGGGRGR